MSGGRKSSKRKAPSSSSSSRKTKPRSSSGSSAAGYGVPGYPPPVITPRVAQRMVRPPSPGERSRLPASLPAANSGVRISEVASYGVVRRNERTGDGLTGDHQPSGAAVKEALREILHTQLSQMLTRQMARNAYNRAITIVMSEDWHRKYSRTYGGRNTRAQITQDAKNLAAAAVADWNVTVPALQNIGFTSREIQEVRNKLDRARNNFYSTGDIQYAG